MTDGPTDPLKDVGVGLYMEGEMGGVWRVLRREGWRVEGEDEWNCGEKKIRNLHYYYL